MKTLRVLKYTGFGILGIAFVVLVIFGVQALWNWLIPGLFNGPLLTFWQTAGLFLLSKILLTGVAPCGRQHHRPGYGYGCRRREWRRKFEDKFRETAEEDQQTRSTEQL
jgi:hypothetical protein